MTIDSHHHFWEYSEEDYGWIGEDMTVLKRHFGPGDLELLAQVSQVDGVVSVQARNKTEETDYLLAHAKAHKLVKGVVGWVDLTSLMVEDDLERYAMEPLVKGFRHTLQGEPDERYMLRDDFNAGVRKLHDYGFCYDILIYHFHLPHTPAFVDKHPGQVFILDHIAKPDIQSSEPDDAWVSGIKELAKRETVFCKLSGMVTEVDPDVSWTPYLLQPYFDVVLEAFGPDRLMFGSDWPVCLLRSNYPTWLLTVRRWIGDLSEDEQAAILGGNAQRAYRLEV